MGRECKERGEGEGEYVRRGEEDGERGERVQGEGRRRDVVQYVATSNTYTISYMHEAG